MIRYEREAPGELIHVDIKKLGRIDGIGHRITRDRRGQSSKRGTGWEYLHVAVDDACRLAYTEILPNEKKESACAFTSRAVAWFARNGVSVQRLMSDNGSAYKSRAFRDLLAELAIRHKRTRPQARMAVFSFIEGWYNPGRRHSALGYKSPIEYERTAPITLQTVSP